MGWKASRAFRRHFGIPFAFILGWLFFGEAPVGRLFPGVLLIVAGGLLIVWREKRARRRAPDGARKD